MNSDLRQKYQDPEFAAKDRDRSLKWAKDNPEKHSAKNLRWAKRNPEKTAKQQKRWYEDNKERTRDNQRKYELERYQSDPNYRLRKLLRNRIYTALDLRQDKKGQKAGSAVTDLGCSVEHLISCLEVQFTPEMSWENHGTYWEIDHIQPLANFDLTDRKQFLEACHYTNLQPLSVEEHLKKSAREVTVRCKNLTGQ
jgi:hypothetical protein